MVSKPEERTGIAEPMYYMHTAFDLSSGVDMPAFRRRWDALIAHLQQIDLIDGCDPVLRRHSDTGLDTDSDRAHAFFVVMRFRDRAQAQKAWDHFVPQIEPANRLHRAVWRQVRDPIFTCWEDIPS